MTWEEKNSPKESRMSKVKLNCNRDVLQSKKLQLTNARGYYNHEFLYTERLPEIQWIETLIL
jgi:hypothetical protein